MVRRSSSIWSPMGGKKYDIDFDQAFELIKKKPDDAGRSFDTARFRSAARA